MCVPPCRLERLELGSCGRGFGDAQASLVSGSGPLASLTTLALGGAYRLSDASLEKVSGAGGRQQRVGEWEEEGR